VDFRVDPRSDVPPSRQIVEAVLDRVARGDLGPGDRLDSVRALAESALVNPNTVGKAYRDLETLGVVAGRNGSGVYVTEGGPATARAQRRRATLDAFRRAARAALAAGHARSDLDAALGGVRAEAARAAARGER
jgi:DNA-binding transcriptional regulator YhcF (GntR family)